jgi:hypothetical protein
MVALLLSLAPLAVLVVLLLRGRFIGEQRILRHLRSRSAPSRTRAPHPLRPRSVVLTSRLARTSVSGRGPPLPGVART